MLKITLICAAFAACSLAAADIRQPVVLLSGFEPFGGSEFNTSWNAVKAFEGLEFGGCRLRTVLLPVVYDEIEKPLQAAIEKWHPVMVLSFGEGTPTLQLERVARNGYHEQRPPDNLGKPPPREKIDPAGPAQFKSTLPIDAMSASLKAAGIQFEVSDNAGGYLCNECFYRLMNLKNAPATRGFIHVPVIKPDDTQAMKHLHEALKVLIESALKNARG